MSVTIDKSDATELEQRQLQTLIKIIDPSALAVHGIDGDFGTEGTNDLREILSEYVPLVDGELSVREAINVLTDIAREAAPEVTGYPDTLADATREQSIHVQNLVNIIDPSVMPKSHIDGAIGPGTRADIVEVLQAAGHSVTLDDIQNLPMNDVVHMLESAVVDLEGRYIVDDCDNLTVIAREVYGDDIDQYTQELMESGDPRFTDNEFAARVHAEQIAVTKIAFANGMEEGVDAHTIHPDQQLTIPDAGPLRDVDGTLDWEALDAEVGPGGPCGCDGPITPVFTETSGGPNHPPATQVPTAPPVQPRIPLTTEIGEDCTATYTGQGRGFLGLQEERPRYDLEGTSGEGYHDARRELGNIHTTGSCRPPSEGGGNDDTPSQDSEGGGVLGGGPVGTGSVGIGNP
ncbi:MAG: hypothetical protein AB8B83_07770 [Bdellovibrionales bacterium]